MCWSLGCGFLSFLAFAVKVGAWFTWELKEVMDKDKDNVYVGFVLWIFYGFLEIFGGKLNGGLKIGSGLLVLLGILCKSGSWVCVRVKRSYG